jgi:hypothetical protein
MSDQKEQIIMMDDQEIKVADLDPDQQRLYVQIVDLKNKQSRHQLEFEQLQEALNNFESRLVTSLKEEEKEEEKEDEEESDNSE